MKFSAGIVAGAIIGAIGTATLGYAVSDRRTKRKLLNSSRRVIDKASEAICNIGDMI